MSINSQHTTVTTEPGIVASILQDLGIHIVEKVKNNIRHNTNNDSLWFPYGSHGFGGLYKNDGLGREIKDIDLVALGAKGLKLRAIVAGVVLSLTAAGLGIKSSMENPVPKIGTTMTTPTKK